MFVVFQWIPASFECIVTLKIIQCYLGHLCNFSYLHKILNFVAEQCYFQEYCWFGLYHYLRGPTFRRVKKLCSASAKKNRNQTRTHESVHAVKEFCRFIPIAREPLAIPGCWT